MSKEQGLIEIMRELPKRMSRKKKAFSVFDARKVTEYTQTTAIPTDNLSYEFKKKADYNYIPPEAFNEIVKARDNDPTLCDIPLDLTFGMYVSKKGAKVDGNTISILEPMGLDLTFDPKGIEIELDYLRAKALADSLDGFILTPAEYLSVIDHLHVMGNYADYEDMIFGKPEWIDAYSTGIHHHIRPTFETKPNHIFHAGQESIQMKPDFTHGWFDRTKFDKQTGFPLSTTQLPGDGDFFYCDFYDSRRFLRRHQSKNQAGDDVAELHWQKSESNDNEARLRLCQLPSVTDRIDRENQSKKGKGGLKR